MTAEEESQLIEELNQTIANQRVLISLYEEGKDPNAVTVGGVYGSTEDEMDTTGLIGLFILLGLLFICITFGACFFRRCSKKVTDKVSRIYPFYL